MFADSHWSIDLPVPPFDSGLRPFYPITATTADLAHPNSRDSSSRLSGESNVSQDRLEIKASIKQPWQFIEPANQKQTCLVPVVGSAEEHCVVSSLVLLDQTALLLLIVSHGQTSPPQSAL